MFWSVDISKGGNRSLRGNENKVLKLKKALYGLKQAPRRWYLTLHEFLEKLDFKRCYQDYCIYVKRYTTGVMFLSIYVDDITLIGTHKEDLEDVISKLSNKFKLQLNGNLKFLLGIEVKRDMERRITTLTQTQYIKNLLEEFNMDACHGKYIPQPVGEVKPEDMNIQGVNDPKIPYRRLIGRLHYLVHGTRPDIASAVRYLSAYVGKYTHTHWQQAKYVLAYLKSSTNYGLVYEASENEQVKLNAFSDANHAEDKTDRKSVAGSVVLMANATVLFDCVKEDIVAQSSTEAEYCSAAMACKSILWARELLEELGYPQDKATTLHVDNTAAIALTQNPENHRKTKHIGMRYHLIRDLVEKEEVEVVYVNTNEQIADFLTKPLPRTKFEYFRERSGVKDVSQIFTSH